MTRVSHDIDRIEVIFDDPNLVANAGLLLVATLTRRLGLEALVNSTVRLIGRVGGALPGRKVLTLVHSMIAGGTHIDHADVLRAGSTGAVLGHSVMAPSTLGTFLRAFTFGHVRQLEAVIGKTLERAWGFGVGPGSKPLVIDIDSTICEVDGKLKQGASYGYTHKLGYHPLLATRADTGEIVQARMRKGSANTQRGARRFIEEVIARVRRAGATGELTVRVDSGFWSNETITVLNRLNVRYTRARGLEPHPLAGMFRYLYVDPCPPALQNPEIADVAAVQPMRPAAGETQVTERSAWLEDLPHRPSVYVTLGTIWNTDLDVFRLVIEALHDRVNVIVTVGRQNDPATLGPQPRGVIIRSYIPQHEVLPWCDAVVAHGGSGTVLGALAHGVPLLVVPQGADQWSNAEQIVTAGAGRRLLRDELSAEAVRDCVMALLSEPSYRKAASKIKEEIRAMPSATDAMVGLEALL